MNNGKLNKRLNKNGCVDTLKSTIPLLGIFAISIFVVQLIMLSLAIGVLKRFKKDDTAQVSNNIT